MLISFIIPHKGRLELLKATVQSIFNQDIELSLIEIIIVSQNSELPIETVSAKHTDKITIILRPESDTISALRNTGAHISQGKFLAFLDADVDLKPNWSATMLTELESDQSRAMLSAAQTYLDDAPPIEKIRTTLSSSALDQAVSFMPGCNLFIKRETFNQAGGFPEHLVTCEDYFFSHQVSKLGQLYYTSKTSFIHLGEDKNLKEMFHKEKWRGQSNLQSIKGRSVPLREVPSFLIPFWLLFFFIMSIISIIMYEPIISFISLFLLLLPIGMYSLRLYKLANNTIHFVDILKFYLVYFPARIIGTLKGLTKLLKA